MSSFIREFFSARHQSALPLKCDNNESFASGVSCWLETHKFNNCYNYAVNDPTGTFAQPGRAGCDNQAHPVCRQDPADSCAMAMRLAELDGLTPIGCQLPCPEGHHKIGVTVNRGSDFHIYREHQNGEWSQKPGNGFPTNRDESGAPIRDIRTATLRPGFELCGCMCVGPKVEIE